jgi:hypothetical protein
MMIHEYTEYTTRYIQTTQIHFSPLIEVTHQAQTKGSQDSHTRRVSPKITMHFFYVTCFLLYSFVTGI